MKFKVTLKDPDKLHDAIREAVEHDVGNLGLPEDEAEGLVDIRSEKVGDICSKWFRYSEYLTVEIDTEAKTCVVVENK